MLRIKRKQKRLRFTHFILILIIIYGIIFIYNSIPLSSTYSSKYSGKLIQIRDNVKLNVYDSKKGQKTILFIHGDWMGLDNWKYQIDFFSNEYRIIAYDRIDCGNSIYKDFTPTFDTCVEDIRLLTDKLNLKDYIIVGHSRGQQMAALYALKYAKENLKGLVLEGIFPPKYRGEDAFNDAIKAKWLDRFRIINLRKIQLRAIKENYLSSNLSFRKKSEILNLIKYHAKKWRYEPKIVAGTNKDLKERFKEINLSVLIINGADYRFGVNRDEYLKCFANAFLVTVKGAAHFPHLEKSSFFNKKLSEFFKNIDF